MIAIARFEVSMSQSSDFRKEIEVAREALAECVGYIDGEIGQNLDQPSLWLLM